MSVPWPCVEQPAEKLLNFIIAEVIRHHEQIADSSLTSDGASKP